MVADRLIPNRNQPDIYVGADLRVRPRQPGRTHQVRALRKISQPMDFLSGLIPSQANIRFSAPTLMKCE